MRSWLLAGLLLLSACTVGGRDGPWLDPEGRPVENSEVLQFRGLSACDEQSVTYIRFFDRQFARDTEEVLGPLRDDNGEELSFRQYTELPSGLEATGYTLRGREVYIDPTNREDYIYVVRACQAGELVERWPRAEGICNEDR